MIDYCLSWTILIQSFASPLNSTFKIGLRVMYLSSLKLTPCWSTDASSLPSIFTITSKMAPNFYSASNNTPSIHFKCAQSLLIFLLKMSHWIPTHCSWKITETIKTNVLFSSLQPSLLGYSDPAHFATFPCLGSLFSSHLHFSSLIWTNLFHALKH